MREKAGVLEACDDRSSDFFHDATMIICGTPDVREMLRKTMEFLSAFVDLDAMALSVFEEKLRAVRRLALCTKDGRSEGESLEKMPESVFRYATKVIRSRCAFVLTGHADDNPARSFMNDCGRSPYQSAVVLHLYYQGAYIGFVDIFSERPDCFSGSDARLLNQLSSPFALYMINFLRFRALEQEHMLSRKENERLRKNFAGDADRVVGFSSGLLRVRQLADDVAATVTPVLISGETGTGKEVIADYIQQQSDRALQPFVKVNCAAIPEQLLENEFFGHDSHAFTGAGVMRKGRFERAQHGTIFLDEVGELPPGAQAKLLRVLESGEMERLGGTGPIALDVRILAATNRSLQDKVRDGSFRGDLYYRLNVFPIALPPLRERRQDIPELVRFFLKKKQKELKLPYLFQPASDELDTLTAYDWPGNVRELANVVERALIQAQRTQHLCFVPDAGMQASVPKPFSVPAFDGPAPAASVTAEGGAQKPFFPMDARTPIVPLATLEREYILHVLRRTNGKIMGRNSAAELLGVNGYTLRKRMMRLGIDPREKKFGPWV